MRSAVLAAVLMRRTAEVLPRIGTYLGSKPLSRSTPSSLLGRSMMCPLEASTEKPRPRNLVSVRDLVGDSTITRERRAPPGPLAASTVLAPAVGPALEPGFDRPPPPRSGPFLHLFFRA